MANWNLPTVVSNYINFVDEVNTKIYDSARMYYQESTNIPNATIRFNRAGYVFDEWETASNSWLPRVIGVAGGGTGSNNPAGIRTNLGLGSMSTQNSNAVAITGGTITGVTYSASDINTGIMALARGGTGSSLALGAAGTLLVSWNGQVIFGNGHLISDLDASKLTAGIAPKVRLPGTTVYTDQSNSIGGTTTLNDTIIISYGTGANNFALRSAYPLMNFNSVTSPVNLKNVQVVYNAGSLDFRQLDDASTVATSVFRVDWNGIVICYGKYIHNLDATNLTSGTVNPARLGSGPADGSTFLRGDGFWAVPAGSGGGGTPIPFPSGMITMFATNCPAGWTRVASLDGRFPLGATSYGQQGGNTRHAHSFSVNTNTDGNHSHTFSAGVGGARAIGNANGTTGNPLQTETADPGSGRAVSPATHQHNFGVNIDIPVTGGSVSGDTSLAGNHYHQVTGTVTENDQYQPYTTVVFCQKD